MTSKTKPSKPSKPKEMIPASQPPIPENSWGMGVRASEGKLFMDPGGIELSSFTAKVKDGSVEVMFTQIESTVKTEGEGQARRAKRKKKREEEKERLRKEEEEDEE